MNFGASNAWFKLWLGLAIVCGLASAVWIYGYVESHVRVVRLDGMFDPAYGYTAGLRERYFRQDFVSAGAIDSYLHDATVLISQPPTANRVYYFDKRNGFVMWRDNIIESGKWWTFPEIQILHLDARWRVAIVQTFCMSQFGVPIAAQQDNCYDVSQLDSLVTGGKGSRRDYREGNVFSLAADKPPPLRLPNSELSITSLQSKLADKDR